MVREILDQVPLALDVFSPRGRDSQVTRLPERGYPTWVHRELLERRHVRPAPNAPYLWHLEVVVPRRGVPRSDNRQGVRIVVPRRKFTCQNQRPCGQSLLLRPSEQGVHVEAQLFEISPRFGQNSRATLHSATCSFSTIAFASCSNACCNRSTSGSCLLRDTAAASGSAAGKSHSGRLRTQESE